MVRLMLSWAIAFKIRKGGRTNFLTNIIQDIQQDFTILYWISKSEKSIFAWKSNMFFDLFTGFPNFDKSAGYPTKFDNTLLEIQIKISCFSEFPKLSSRCYMDIQQNLGSVSLLLDIIQAKT